jgi:hypothetical protein
MPPDIIVTAMTPGPTGIVMPTAIVTTVPGLAPIAITNAVTATIAAEIATEMLISIMSGDASLYKSGASRVSKNNSLCRPCFAVAHGADLSLSFSGIAFGWGFQSKLAGTSRHLSP